jgi:hypothetical protein
MVKGPGNFLDRCVGLMAHVAKHRPKLTRPVGYPLEISRMLVAILQFESVVTVGWGKPLAISPPKQSLIHIQIILLDYRG